MKLNDINIRDPFILVYGGKYYMYGSRVSARVEGCPWGKQDGFDVYISEDLENWSNPKSVFEKNENFWGTRDFWAPEVHIYNGKFYMFASFIADGKCRGTHILVSDTPDGKFSPISKEPATPADWECLDGTLYVDKKGKPHIVFCHEWVQITNGTVCEMELSEDLREPVSKPRVLFAAKDYPQVRSGIKTRDAFVTDGPFLFKCDNGDLICIWSSFNENGYTVLASKSDNGDIDGNWEVLAQPLSSKDGGHGMIFEDLLGNKRFIMHKPNTATEERPTILNLSQENNKLEIK